MNQEIVAADVARSDLRARFDSTIAAARARIAATRPGRRSDPDSARTCKPWLKQGISERTYYRRKAAAPQPLQQHDAHVGAWLATISNKQRMAYNGLVRRSNYPRRPAITDVPEMYAKLAGAK
ncbi:hypothetical protein [Beijerinckia sp. L45]|uniref:hypothetical protein n=1 Tax=Beijerinckia sp. L45 TaxID=1641855 RepID=UPI00131CE23B|nr:hypothetical protein [Beijerinckia sp. L45]